MIDSIRNVLPLWAVALVIAAAGPWLVRALAVGLEERAKRRALVIVNRARASKQSGCG